MLNVSIFILTYNEEQNIRKCLKSIEWSNDIVILDSFSSDNTLEIAKEYFNNIRIIQRPFDNYSSQRNYGLRNISFLNPWVLIIDADETCTIELQKELLSSKIHESQGFVTYSLRRKTFFAGKWLKHNSLYNVWLERLIQPKSVSFYGHVHEKLKYNGRGGKLLSDLEHFPFSKGIEHWISRRNKFSTLSAERELCEGYNFNFKELFSKDPIKARASLNAIYRRMPLRWVIFFFYNFFIKFCFLDGIRGMHLILLETFYEFIIVCKVHYKRLNK